MKKQNQVKKWKLLMIAVWILFLVVCGLLEVIAIFCPMMRFIIVDFPTFGLPMIAIYPDLNVCFSIYPLVSLCK